MRRLFICLLSLIPLAASAQPAIYVLPVQSEIPFLTQMPGTNIFVGPGASLIFSGKVVINGKSYDKFPEPPLEAPDWANGLKERIERAIRSRKDLRIVSKKADAQSLLRVIVTRFGHSKEDSGIGVNFSGAIMNGKTEEAQASVSGSAVESEDRDEPESLSWPDFIATESDSSLGIATGRAAADLAGSVARKLGEAKGISTRK